MTHDSRIPLTRFEVDFDDETVAMLIEYAEACHRHPADLIVAIVRDVLRDDFIAHGNPWGHNQTPPTTH